MEAMDGAYLVVHCTKDDQGNQICSHALIHYVATGFAFVDEEFASSQGLPLYSLKDPQELELIDGQSIGSTLVTVITTVQSTIDKHVEKISMFVNKLVYTVMAQDWALLFLVAGLMCWRFDGFPLRSARRG